jgi:pimeloyl-ACP methyl ester carboxylesterase
MIRTMSRPSRNQALLAAGVAGAAAGAARLSASARRTAAESRERRASADRGRPLSIRGADGGFRHARVHGPEDAPTLVLVHCWTGTQELWHKQVDGLSDELRIVTYDHRGHGLSEDARDGDYSLDALAADLAIVLEQAAFDGQPILLAGHSLGAMTIAAWAETHRGRVIEQVRGVALLSTGLEQLTAETQVIGPWPGPFATFRGRLADLVLETPASLPGMPVPVVRAAAAYAALGPAARDEDIDLTARMALDCRTAARTGVGRAMARMALLEKLDALEAPTIVVAGERDLMTPIAHAERIELALPRPLGLRVDSEAGHMTPLESPELVNDAIREVVAATSEGSPASQLAA